MSDHRKPAGGEHHSKESPSEHRTHELLECIAELLLKLGTDGRFDERLQQMETLLQVLIVLGESQDQKLGRVIELLTPPATFPQPISAEVRQD